MFQQKLFSLMNARWGLWPRISWNPHEICWISWNLLDFMWNLPDFKIMSFCMMIKYRSFIFRKTNQKSFCWNIWFYKVWGGFHVKSKDLLQGIVTLCFSSVTDVDAVGITTLWCRLSLFDRSNWSIGFAPTGSGVILGFPKFFLANLPN